MHSFDDLTAILENTLSTDAFSQTQNQEVLYVTERAVFRLQENGLELEEIAPGIDLQKDILDQMDFQPLMNTTPTIMDPSIFQETLHG